MSSGAVVAVTDNNSSSSPIAAAAVASTSKPIAIPPPDEKGWNEKIDVEKRAAMSIRAQLNELESKLSVTNSGRDEHNRKRSELRERSDELYTEINNLEQERKGLLNKVELRQKEGKEMRTSAQTLKKSIGFSSETDIEKRISELSHILQTSTMSLSEEKKIIAQISQLQKSKPLLGKYANLETRASNFEDHSIAPLRTRIELLRTKLAELRTCKKEVQEKQRTLIDERARVTAPVKALFEEKQELNQKMREHALKQQEYKNALWVEQQAYNIHQQELKNQRMEKLREEKRKRLEEQKRVDIERQLDQEDELPLENELSLVQQALSYIKKLQGAEALGAKELNEGNLQEEVLPVTLQTEGGKNQKAETLLLPKNKREEEFFYAPKKKGVAGRKVGKRPKTLRHEAGTIQWFNKCGVLIPMSVDNIPKCLEALKTKQEYYTEQRKQKAEDSRIRKLELLSMLDVMDGKPPRYVPPPDAGKDKTPSRKKGGVTGKQREEEGGEKEEDGAAMEKEGAAIEEEGAAKEEEEFNVANNGNDERDREEEGGGEENTNEREEEDLPQDFREDDEQEKHVEKKEMTDEDEGGARNKDDDKDVEEAPEDLTNNDL